MNCSTSLDHPPAIASIRLFAKLDAKGTPQRLDNLCPACTRKALEQHGKDIASGGIASLVVLSLSALASKVATA